VLEKQVYYFPRVSFSCSLRANLYIQAQQEGLHFLSLKEKMYLFIFLLFLFSFFYCHLFKIH